MADTFQTQIVAILPKLRVQALALTRNRAQAEDLVQDAVCNALGARDSFIPGTNFAAWMHRILRNRFISDLRKRRATTDIDDLPGDMLSSKADHEDRLAVKDLSFALARLPADQREALVLVVLQGMSYQELAEATGCAVGTAKSRVFRARRQLEAWMMGELPESDRLRQQAMALRHEVEERRKHFDNRPVVTNAAVV
ncbi:RNA polymerase sigma-E factor (sigma-24) protein 2 [Acetobacter aceti NRIC 0242]|uniref:RNA polymerase sigma factor n=1 Tax=Acetobacter aceti NBRC 14818 TaxID=887700 RepID=A0AB33IH87_ACEAC|nr:sigma-70 family RNA polymerase sigma factor [Acetobacter aceti]TCS31969.1 RNA polymerase sigma-70 factor (ECF subfamily) [Acetobacter aceti NBRC 14818]BCK77271.1 RNA polymerase sigma factor [Acetobacter aceti NBRC 14818]GAN58404.1 DNA-directed RNA polymerase sigma-E/Sigma-24/FecI [Acetobacter aceti NBRC 14818]GBO81630.1 RNA polymerase sigma-E factor (sigma-24) protein 2 [Acetobacter aceti NRIC 0242]